MMGDCSAVRMYVYIPPTDIRDEYYWLRGCNTLYRPHHHHSLLPYLVKSDSVALMNIDELLQKYEVRSIKFLKIDTEGHDCIILNGLFQYLKPRPITEYPKRIEFETNHLTSPDIVDSTIEHSKSLGYTVVTRGHDTILEYNGTPLIQTLRINKGRVRLV
jgi:hypothetical protein